jgi:polygalacturonase
MPVLMTLALAATAAASAAPALDTTPEAHGAMGNGKADDSAAIRAALAACAAVGSTGGCRITFSNSYLSGPLSVNSSGLELRVTGTLAMLPRSRYPASSTTPFLSNTAGVSGLLITGGGLIDGQGKAWWPCKHEGCFRPHLMAFGGVHGLTIDGMRLQNPPNHFIEVSDCVGVRVRNLHSEAPNNSPNTDGINFYGGSDQLFEDSVVHNGDDCVSVVPTGDPASALCVTQPERCHGGSVIIRNISCLGGHGVSIGSVRHGTISNTTFENITLTKGPTQALYSSGGCRIKSYPNGTGSISGVVFRDIIVEGVAYPLQLQARYCPGGQGSCPNGATAIALHDITFENIRGTGKGTIDGIVGTFICNKLAPCTNITLDRVQLASDNGAPARFVCENCGGTSSATQPTSCFAGTD